MLDQVEITILCENRVSSPHLRAELGLSIHVSSPEGDFLFDTGSGNAFIHNAKHLNIPLEKVSQILFSHGHRDHTGGIYYFLKEHRRGTIICHFNIFNRKFRVHDGVKMEVGIPYEEKELTSLGGEFIFHSKPYRFSPHILSTGEIPRITDYETPNEFHQELVLESYITDELRDDMAMIIQTTRGLIILLGDSHSGPVNTVKHAMSITGNQEVYAIIGGLNLANAPEEKIIKITNALKKLEPQFIVPLHSTGFLAMNYLYQAFRERMLLFNTGDRFTLD